MGSVVGWLGPRKLRLGTEPARSVAFHCGAQVHERAPRRRPEGPNRPESGGRRQALLTASASARSPFLVSCCLGVFAMHWPPVGGWFTSVPSRGIHAAAGPPAANARLHQGAMQFKRSLKLVV